MFDEYLYNIIFKYIDSNSLLFQLKGSMKQYLYDFCKRQISIKVKCETLITEYDKRDKNIYFSNKSLFAIKDYIIVWKFLYNSISVCEHPFEPSATYFKRIDHCTAIFIYFYARMDYKFYPIVVKVEYQPYRTKSLLKYYDLFQKFYKKYKKVLNNINSNESTFDQTIKIITNNNMYEKFYMFNKYEKWEHINSFFGVIDDNILIPTFNEKFNKIFECNLWYTIRLKFGNVIIYY